MGQVPFIGVVQRVSDINGVVVRVIGSVGDEDQRGNGGLVFFVGLVIVDF